MNQYSSKRCSWIARFYCWSQVYSLVLASSPDSSSSSSPGSSTLPSVSMHTGSWGLPTIDHYSTIGFPSPWSVEEQVEHTRKFVSNPDTQTLPASTPGYNMLHLATRSGAELWGGGTAEGNFFGNDPHFAGPSRMRVQLTKRIEREHEEGFFQGKTMGDLQFDFYCPTYQLLGKHLVLPATVTVQIAAFACEIQIFDSLQDYQKHNENEKANGNIAFADQSFSSMNIFDKEDKKLGWAMMTGHVVQAELRINERTGESFYWALVETLFGCQCDVVIHPMLVNQPPRPGSILQGAFYLSGCVLPDEEST